MTQAQLRDIGRADRMAGFREFLVAARNRAFGERQSMAAINGQAPALAGGLARIREESAQFRRDSMLATIGDTSDNAFFGEGARRRHTGEMAIWPTTVGRDGIRRTRARGF